MHEEIVDACIGRISREVPKDSVEQALVQLVAALWAHAARTLSEITLDAIFQRAHYLSAERFPLLATFEFSHNDGIGKGVSKSKETPDIEQVIEAFRYLLVTILTLFGNLTADILVSGLYRELQMFSLQNNDSGVSAFDPPAQEGRKMDNLRCFAVSGDSGDSLDRIPTYISNLDEILDGGLPKGSVTIVAGSPGTGKTILSQQICFSNATPEKRAVFFQTVSEPTVKTLRYLRQFDFFDPKKLENSSVEFVDLGGTLTGIGAKDSFGLIMEHVKRIKPVFVVIDSFKALEHLAASSNVYRRLAYELTVNLTAWECTSLLLGEFATEELESNPLFSIADGLIKLKIRRESSEEQRFIQIMKIRGTNHSRDEHSLAITKAGIGVYAPRVTIRREREPLGADSAALRFKLGISRIDELLANGVPAGSSLIVAGVSGTGKTLLSLEFIYRGAKEFGERGIYFSFEETDDRLRAEARGVGWEIDELIRAGMIEIVYVPQPEITVEKHLLMMSNRIREMKAKRIVVDSVSLFVHKIADPQIVREKIFQLATLVQKNQGVGFFTSDIPYGSGRLSRFGVEETVVDGVILLTASEKDHERERFIEIYKLRNTAHLDGRHKLEITGKGILITPRDKFMFGKEGPQKKRGTRSAA